MAQKVTRNTRGVRRQARAQGTSRKVRKARSQGRSLLGGLLALLPFTDEQLHRAFTVLILGAMVALALFIGNISGASGLAYERFSQVAANAGFKVRHVEVRGTERLSKLLVDERVLGQEDLSMVKLDLGAVREDLLTLPWVADARVSRQLPNVLVVDIVEREPHAVLRRGDRLLLIDKGGVELEGVSPEQAEAMLLIEGAGAQGKIAALSELLDAAPALRQQVVSANWVGNRRWDLTFRTGQRLALPEGKELSAAALISFAEADGVHRLIGGEVVAFDLRNPPRMYMRVPGREERQQMQIEGDS